jgi:hypothetical protein
MTGFREFVAIVLVECLLTVGFPQQSQATAATERSERIRQKVEQLGAGAEVRLMLRDQPQALRGTVESFDDSAFRLRQGGNEEQRAIRFADVTLLEFPQRKYHAGGSPDPVTVRRVAVELGVGFKVHMQTVDRNTFVGRIAKLDAQQLFLKIGEGGPVSVSYAQISELKPKRMSTLAKVGIGVGVTFGILFGVAAAVCGRGACS